MIRFWGRELMGWLLVFLGVGIFYLVIALMLNAGAEFIFEGPVLTMIGIIVFRGGIHLLKVAVAARIAMQAQVEVQKTPAPTPRHGVKTHAPWDW